MLLETVVTINDKRKIAATQARFVGLAKELADLAHAEVLAKNSGAASELNGIAESLLLMSERICQSDRQCIEPEYSVHPRRRIR